MKRRGSFKADALFTVGAVVLLLIGQAFGVLPGYSVPAALAWLMVGYISHPMYWGWVESERARRDAREDAKRVVAVERDPKLRALREGNGTVHRDAAGVTVGGVIGGPKGG